MIVHTCTTRPVLGIVIGSTRPGRVGPVVADWFAGEAEIHQAFDVRGVTISNARRVDAGEIMTLQRAAFLTDAQLHGDPFLPSLTQTKDEIANLIDDPSGVVLVARLERRLVGSVRASLDGNTAHISRLMTAPDVQGLGIGRQLMESIEAALDSDQLELSTGSLSTSNLSFYDRLGYRTISTATLENDMNIVTMNKPGRNVGKVVV